VGYQTQNLTVGSRRSIDVALQTAAIGLEQVVVVGYGTQEKGELTGSVSSVSGEAVENLPVAGASQALQGRAAGVNVVRNGGAPGSGGSIRIRGTGTVNSADPLVVIDGVPSGGINDINPNDIASIEVLKDASTSAIYGLRAANGVVIITTKRGKLNEGIKISLNAYSGVSSPVRTIDVLDAPTLAMLKRERYTNDGIDGDPIWDDPAYQSQMTNWQDELLNNGVTQNYDFTLRGGGQRSAFSLTGGYFQDKGMMKNSFYERYYLRINSDHEVGNWLNIGQNLQLTRQRGNFLNTNSAQTGILWSAIRFHPGLPVINSDGSYSSSQVSGEFGDINNPIFTVDSQDAEQTRHRVLGNIFAEIKLLENLKFKANFALDGTISDSDNFSIQVTDQIRQNDLNDLNRSYSEGYSLLAEYFLTYEKTFANAHDFKFVGGFTAQSFISDGFSVGKDDFPNEDDTQRVLDAGRVLEFINGSRSEINLASWFGRVNYAFKEKYLLSATLRRDGTSRFAEGNRWGSFPAFSAGWKISREPWFADNGLISFMKISGGWGQLGNQSVAPFQYLALIAGNRRYSFGGQQVTGASLSRIPNENISWETTEITDFGVDLGFLDNRLLATVNYFIKDTEDMLLAPPTIGSIGRADIPDQNIGAVRNQGLELELSFQNAASSALNFTISANASFIQNEVLGLGGREFLASRFYGRPNQEIVRTFEGEPIGTFFGWQTDGLYQTEQEIGADANIANDPRREQGLIQPGDVKFLDLNNDGVVDDQDRTILGDPFPDMTYGLNASLRFRQFDFNAFLLGVAGVEIFNADRMQGLDPTYPFNMYAETINRWNGPNTSNEIPRMTTKRDNLNHRTSDLFIEKGDFLRLKNLTIGYTLPDQVTQSIGISNWRLYITGQNVLTLTGYSGMDPELGYVDGNLQANVDYAQYPQARTFIFGTSVNF
jgi:TonB-linked SusC/RagA family outer membrane protein